MLENVNLIIILTISKQDNLQVNDKTQQPVSMSDAVNEYVTYSMAHIWVLFYYISTMSNP